MAEENKLRTGRVWDLPTRLVHWLLAALIPFSWWSATHDHLSWHIVSGLTILGLLVFRLIWGFAGASTARFSGFVAGPGRVRAYLGGRLGAFVGHNPLGGWSILAMFVALTVQVGLGLFSITEDGFQGGPLTNLVSFDLGRTLAHLHHLVFWVVVGLIALHLLAIAFHAVRGRNLVGAMVTGRAAVPPDAPPPVFAPPWRFILAALAAAAVAWFVGHGLRV